MPPKGKYLILAAAIAVSAPLAVPALAQIITSDIAFPRGGTQATVAGTIAGYQTRDYVVRARAGQTLKVVLSGSPIVYFNVLPPGSNDQAIFVGSTGGNSFKGTLNMSGAYKIRVYQMRATARRNQRGSFRLAVAVIGAQSAGGGAGGGIGGLVGMDSVKAIDAMSERGFTNVDDFSSGNTQYGIFYKRANRMCVQMTMSGGKVLDVRDIHTHPKCR